MDILKVVATLQSFSCEGELACAITEAVNLLIEQGERIVDLESNGGWIPVSLGFFPEEFVSVLVYIPTDAPLPTVKEAYRVNNTWLDKMSIYSDAEITHWMPMPKPPEEVQH